MAHLRRIFSLLVLYRWLSLLPPLIFLFASPSPPLELGALLVAAFSNLLITLIPTQLNRLIRRWPMLVAVDLAFVALLLALTGGWRSPYNLFALSPLLASAFFFQHRGALIAAGAFAPMFAIAVGAAAALGGPPPDGLSLSLAVVGFFLVAGIFGYAATLLARVREAHDDLGRAHRELEIIHNLTISLQNAPEVRGSAGARARRRDARSRVPARHRRADRPATHEPDPLARRGAGRGRPLGRWAGAGGCAPTD